MKKYTYDDLCVENYVNTNEVGIVGNVPIYLQDIAIAALLSGLPQHYRGLQSSGKTQLMRDFYFSYFAGKKNAIWEEGRSDYRPRDLFQRLNISLAKGKADNLPEIKAVYSADNGVEYLIRSYSVGKDGNIELDWKKISKEEKEKIVYDFSITSSDLMELRKISTKAFFIDEFNRCPEVVMNLFYGLMHGEVLNDGTIVKLGNGYYTGIAASNPDDFEGTFKMDKAMWSRFRVVLDFSAYEPTSNDDKKLIERMEKPGLIDSKQRDLVRYLEQTAEEIKQTRLTTKEKIILAYLKRGLNYCSNPNLGISTGTSKSQIKWPLVCSQCPKQTTLCGILKGLDQRSIDAVKFLAKGLEKIASMKGAEKIDPIESFILAYTFVVPYKGVINPKIAKENGGIEGLVIRTYADGLMQILRDKFEQLDRFILTENLMKSDDLKKYPLTRLKTEFKKIGKIQIYEEVYNQLIGNYDKTKLIEDYVRHNPEETESFRKSALFESLKDQEQREVLSKYIKKNYPKIFDYISSNFIKPLNLSSREIKSKFKLKDSNRIAVFKENLEAGYCDYLTKLISKMFLKKPDIIDDIISKQPDLEKRIKESFSPIVEEKIKSTRYVPNDPEFKKGLREKLVQKLNESNLEERTQKLDELFEEEWSFLKDYFEDYVVEIIKK